MVCTTDDAPICGKESKGRAAGMIKFLCPLKNPLKINIPNKENWNMENC